jgi:primosomal protein N' (replication factor Y) (superfamily II helicase)
MMYADIVVLTPGDPKKSTFTYSIPETITLVGMRLKKGEMSPTIHESDLIPGHFVTVPYGKKSCPGVVLSVHSNEPDFATRPIEGILHLTPVLTPHLLHLAQWMADYYHEPLRNCIQTVLVFEKQVRLPKEKENIISDSLSVVLNEEQIHVLHSIISRSDSHSVSLLHGITGSGKTEIYLQLIAEILQQEKQVIYLVPEIALTPQTIKRVEARFPNLTTIINSQISDGERYKAFVECQNGSKPIIIGSRSALFAPYLNLGAIIIDEAHDYSYKQDNSPHYHAVTAAEEIARFLKIPLILGSATPRIEDYHKAKQGVNDWSYLALTKRATNSNLPKISVVDMRIELKKQNYSTISDTLLELLKERVQKKEQSILFLNKRGMASSLVCRLCGWTAECPRCAVALTLHKDLYGVLENVLLCHHCDFQTQLYSQCQKCESLYIKPMGSGTERVESDLRKLIPNARFLRMDRDTTAKKGSHSDIYHQFLNHEVDILIGTQMITKGWDVPNVTLVGIVNADTALHMPYFKASETMFQLVTQVSGRAGRGEKPGNVVLQTYNPDHYAVLSAVNHSYEEFYHKEIAFRKDLNYPPFSTLVQLVISDVKQDKAQYQSEVLVKKLALYLREHNLDASVQILGPSSSIIPKLRNKWYYQILLKGEKVAIDQLLEVVPGTWSINIDPENSV